MNDIRNDLKDVFLDVFDIKNELSAETSDPWHLLRLSNVSTGYALIESIASGRLPAFTYTDGRKLMEFVITDLQRKKNLDATEAISIDGEVFRVEDSDTPGIFSLKPIYRIIGRPSGETWTPPITTP